MNPTSENPSERETGGDADLELDSETVDDLDADDDNVKGGRWASDNCASKGWTHCTC